MNSSGWWDRIDREQPMNHLSRRAMVRLAGFAAAGCAVSAGDAAEVSLFDGQTLDGWIQIENSAISLSAAGITDPVKFAERLSTGTDALSVFLRSRLQDSVKTDLTAYSASSANAKAVVAAAEKDLNQAIGGPSIYDAARFHGMVLRPETAALLKQQPQGVRLARLNKLLLEDAYPAELARNAVTG